MIHLAAPVTVHVSADTADQAFTHLAKTLLDLIGEDRLSGVDLPGSSTYRRIGRDTFEVTLTFRVLAAADTFPDPFGDAQRSAREYVDTLISDTILDEPYVSTITVSSWTDIAQVA